MNTTYLVRDRDTGLYWRGAKVRHGQVQRSAWTESPAKAWHCWQKDQVDRLFRGHFHKGNIPNYEVVTFQLVLVTQEGEEP